MKYVDKKGKEIEISYSTLVQERLERTLKETLRWRMRMYYTLNTIKWLMAIVIILGLIGFFYLDSKNAFTFIGQKFFC